MSKTIRDVVHHIEESEQLILQYDSYMKNGLKVPKDLLIQMEDCLDELTNCLELEVSEKFAEKFQYHFNWLKQTLYIHGYRNDIF